MKLTQQEKRKAVINRLNEQLKKGTKPRKTGRKWESYDKEELVFNSEGKPIAVKLNQADITRINKEIAVLEARV